MASVACAAPQETMAPVVELRVLRRFPQELGLAATSSEDEWSVGPCEVWAGP